MGLNAGGGSSAQRSGQMSAGQRQAIYNQAMANVKLPGGDAYDAPEQKMLTGGDYDNLQGSLVQGYTAPLDYAKGRDIEMFNNSAGAKGIWSTGLALKGEQDINSGYAPQYAKAGADATNKRYDLQTTENAAGNAMNLETALQKYNATWRPQDYKAGVFSQTGGGTSTGRAENFNMGFQI